MNSTKLLVLAGFFAAAQAAALSDAEAIVRSGAKPEAVGVSSPAVTATATNSAKSKADAEKDVYRLVAASFRSDGTYVGAIESTESTTVAPANFRVNTKPSAVTIYENPNATEPAAQSPMAKLTLTLEEFAEFEASQRTQVELSQKANTAEMKSHQAYLEDQQQGVCNSHHNRMKIWARAEADVNAEYFVLLAACDKFKKTKTAIYAKLAADDAALAKLEMQRQQARTESDMAANASLAKTDEALASKKQELTNKFEQANKALATHLRKLAQEHAQRADELDPKPVSPVTATKPSWVAWTKSFFTKARTKSDMAAKA